MTDPLTRYGRSGPDRRVVLGGLASLGAAGCARRPRRLRIGYQKGGVLLLARARGGLETALGRFGPVSLEWVEFVAGPPMLEAMRAGAIDIGAVGDTPPIFAQAAGAPIVYAAAVPNADAAEAVIVPARSPIRSVAQLRGARIGLTKNSSSHLLMIEALETAGLTMRDVLPAFLSPPDAAGAFASGAVDAWAIWDPFLALAQARAPTRTLIDRGRLRPSNSFIVAFAPFAAREPRLLAATLDFLASVSAWENANVDAAAAIIAARTGLPIDVAVLTLRRAPFALRPVDAIVAARQQSAADIFHREGFIPRPVVVKDAVWSGWTPAG